MHRMIDVIRYGDRALLVNFEQRIDRSLHRRVMSLYHHLLGKPGVRYMIPAYCSLTVAYDPSVIQEAALKELIGAWDDDTGTSAEPPAGRHHEIPVCYDPEFGPDQAEVSRQTGRTVEELIAAHTRKPFYIYMLGFMPGFAYMGDMPKKFQCTRRTEPRVRVPTGSVAIAGRQTCIYPSQSPGGWQIIGRTPLRVFRPEHDQPFLFAAGDTVQFFSILVEEYRHILEKRK